MPHVHHPDAATEVYERVAVDIDEQRALRFLGEHRRRDPNPRRDGVVPPLHQSRLFGPGISVLILVDSSIVATSSCRANSFQYTLRRLPSDTPERDSRARCLHRPRFLGEREQAEKLVRYVGSEEGRDLSMVVGGVDFNHVAADDLEAGEAPHELLRLATREAPDLRTPHPDLDGARGIEEVLFASPPERRAVRVLLTEVGVPGVGMGVELHEGERSVHSRSRPKFWQGDGMVAAQDYQGYSGLVHRCQALLYVPVALLYVAWDDGNVTVVYDREVVEDRHVQARVVAPQEVGSAAYPFGTETGPGPEGGACIERRTYDGGVGVLQVLRVRQAHEGSDAREARRLERVGRLVAGQLVLIRSGEQAPSPVP